MSLDATFLIMPLRSLTVFDKTSVLTLPLALAFALSAAWALAALAFRRAADAGFTEWVAAYAIVPVIQIRLFAVLCVAPPRVARDPRPPVGDDAAEPMSWVAITQGLLAGAGLTVFAVAVGALAFGVYGYGMFVVLPFLIGAMTGATTGSVACGVPSMTRFETVETIEVDAAPERVWDSVVHVAHIDAPPALLFHLGVAYPVGGEIVGTGVGAERRGEFSTGTAIERVTEWVDGRKLAFTVVRDVPAMQEISPYAHVHAPHVRGYFRTTSTSFELMPRADGRTMIVERTAHELRLDPVLYWLPLARWILM